MRVRRLLAATTATAVLAGSAFLTACSSSGSDSGSTATSAGKYALGLLTPLTGAAAAIGKEHQQVVQMAVDDINAHGGINGAKLSVDVQDSQLNPQVALSEAQQMASAGIKNIMVAGSTIVLGLLPMAKQQGLLLDNTHAQSAQIAEEGAGTAISYLPDASVEMTALAKAAKTCLGYSKVAVIPVDDDYGHNSAAAFKSAFEGVGGRVVMQESAPVGNTDFRAVLQKAAASGAQALLPIGEGAFLGNAANQNKSLHINLPLIAGGSGVLPTNYDVAGPALAGTHIEALIFKPATAAAKAFQTEFEQKFHAPPSTYAAISWDAVHMIANGFRQVGTDTAKLYSYLQHQNYTGVMGTYPMTLGAHNMADLKITATVAGSTLATMQPWSCEA